MFFKINNLRLKMATLFAVLGFAFFVNVGTAGETEKEVLLPSECKQCHMDLKHKSDIPVATLEKCQSCHKDAEKHAATAPNQPKVDAHGGMGLPMYSPQSRLGDAPNEMVSVPAGPFVMGTNSRLPDEGPEHTLELPAFLIDQFEVTNIQYKKFSDETKRRSPTHFVNRTYPEGKADHPVTFVSWVDADAYCTWAGKRLPTDQEWEEAARGPDGRIFPWGNEFDFYKANTPHRWKLSGKEGDTTQVGSFEAGKSPYGVYDMTGNVWEWTASWYKPYPGNTHPTENYGEKYKTLKGGSWWNCSFYQCGISAPTYNRSFFLRATKNASFGFRCAKSAPDTRYIIGLNYREPK